MTSNGRTQRDSMLSGLFIKMVFRAAFKRSAIDFNLEQRNLHM
jgi:hypothetical protein